MPRSFSAAAWIWFDIAWPLPTCSCCPRRRSSATRRRPRLQTRRFATPVSWREDPNVRHQRRTPCVPHRETREQCTYLRPRRGVFYCSDVVRPFFTAALSLLYEKVASSFTTCRPKPVLNVSGALKEVEYSTFFCHAYHSYTWRPRADNAGPCADANKRTAARCRRVRVRARRGGAGPTVRGARARAGVGGGGGAAGR